MVNINTEICRKSGENVKDNSRKFSWLFLQMGQVGNLCGATVMCTILPKTIVLLCITKRNRTYNTASLNTVKNILKEHTREIILVNLCQVFICWPSGDYNIRAYSVDAYQFCPQNLDISIYQTFYLRLNWCRNYFLIIIHVIYYHIFSTETYTPNTRETIT